jgi:hypothetical protein
MRRVNGVMPADPPHHCNGRSAADCSPFRSEENTFASESDEVRLGFPDLVLSYHHERAAVQARRILSGVQRIQQEFLVAGHSTEGLTSNPSV